MSNQTQGHAFERWAADVLRPYAPNVKLTKHQAHYDLGFVKEEKPFLMECKCFSFVKGNNGTSKVNALCLNPAQVKFLKRLKIGLSGENEVTYLVGILFKPFDIYPVALELSQAMKLGKWKDSKSRKWISMNQLLKAKPLREWIAEQFGVKSSDVAYPEFRKYLV